MLAILTTTNLLLDNKPTKLKRHWKTKTVPRDGILKYKSVENHLDLKGVPKK